MTITNRTRLGGQDIATTSRGAVDFAGHRARYMVELPAQFGGTGGSIMQIVVGETLYMSLPQQPEVYFELASKDLVGTALGSSLDPASGLDLVSTRTDVREVGPEPTAGKGAGRFEATLDVAKTLEEASGDAKAVLRQSFAQLGATRVPMIVVLDEQGRIVRFQQDYELPGGGTSTNLVEFSAFGAPVDVQAPPADQVRDGGELLAAIRVPPGGRGTGPTTAPSPS